MNSSNNSGGQSFAERYGKKNTSFTAQAAKNDQKPQPTQKSASEMAAEKKPTKQIDPIKKMQAELIYLVKGIDAGRNAWYYVLVDRLKLQLFLKALNDDIIHLENYGKILYSAYGDEPPAEITNRLKEEYGID
jgi:hypothetical protein